MGRSDVGGHRPGGRRGSGDKRRQGLIAIGQITAPHGVSGEVRVYPLTDFPERFKPGVRVYVGGEDSPRVVERARPSGGMILVKLSGVEDRDSAEGFRGAYVQVERNAVVPLPEGSYYDFEIVGLNVETTSGDPVGKVVDVLRTGANAVYVARTGDREILIPAIRAVVKSVEPSVGRMVIDPPPGLIEEPDMKPGGRAGRGAKKAEAENEDRRADPFPRDVPGASGIEHPEEGR